MRQKYASGLKRPEIWKTESRGQSTQKLEHLGIVLFSKERSEQNAGGSGWDGSHVRAAGSISLGSFLTLPPWKPAAGSEYKHHFFRGTHVECNNLILTHSFNFHLLTHRFLFWLFYAQNGCVARHGRRPSRRSVWCFLADATAALPRPRGGFYPDGLRNTVVSSQKLVPILHGIWSEKGAGGSLW